LGRGEKHMRADVATFSIAEVSAYGTHFEKVLRDFVQNACHALISQ
jgi:hypothetical protein